MSLHKTQNKKNENVLQSAIINEQTEKNELFTCNKRKILDGVKSGFICDKEKLSANQFGNPNYGQEKAEIELSKKLIDKELETKFTTKKN